jgi:hypothetical protein
MRKYNKNMKKNNKTWFTLVLAMWIVIVISLIAYNILEYIIPFWRDVKWIENSSRAYYLANTWIEEWLYHISTRTDEKTEWSKAYVWDISHTYNTFSSWTILPPAWEWNTIYDDDNNDTIINKDRNTISQWSPLQLSVWNWYIQDLNDFNIAFRTPNLDFYDLLHSSIETLSWGSLPIVNWQLTSLNNTLNASWWIILANQILDSKKSYDSSDSSTYLLVKDLLWTDLNWTDNISIETFYWNNCNWTNSWCTLKFSIVNKLELDTNNVSVPYLEWKLDVWNASDYNNLPLRYTKIESAWKSIWYKKELEIKVPTKTVNQAFDFTVFQ